MVKVKSYETFNDIIRLECYNGPHAFEIAPRVCRFIINSVVAFNSFPLLIAFKCDGKDFGSVILKHRLVPEKIQALLVYDKPFVVSVQPLTDSLWENVTVYLEGTTAREI